MSSLKEIHDWLNKQERMLDGRPIWRLVWSENLIEKREGEFSDWYGNIFIRSYYGIKEGRKYNYIHERWIVEKFVPCDVRKYSIIGDNGGTYEPLYVFETRNREFLMPTLKTTQFLVEFARSNVRSTPGENKAWAERAEDEEFKKCYEIVGAETSDPIASLIHTASGVSMHVVRPK